MAYLIPQCQSFRGQEQGEVRARLGAPGEALDAGVVFIALPGPRLVHVALVLTTQQCHKTNT